MAKITIDLTRNLCENCKRNSDCSYELQEYGENGNVIRCKKYSKVKELRPRANEGEPFYHYANVDDNDKSKGFKIKCRIESKSRIDNLLYEVKNYFLSEIDCQNAIDILRKK